MAFSDPQLVGWNGPAYAGRGRLVGYGEPAARRGAVVRLYRSAALLRLQKALAGVAPNGRVLAAGGGNGRLAELILDLGFRVLVSEPDPAKRERITLRLARFGGRSKVLYADVQGLEAAGERFDAVVCGDGVANAALDDAVAQAVAARSLTAGPIVVAWRAESNVERLLRAAAARLGRRTRLAYEPPKAAGRQLVRNGLRVVMRFRAWPLVGGTTLLVCR